MTRPYGGAGGQVAPGDVVVGSLPGSQRFLVVLGSKLRNKSGLDKYVARLGQRRELKPQAFTHACGLGSVAGVHVLNPVDVPAIYGVDSDVPTAAGINVGILSDGNETQILPDLGTITTNDHLPAATSVR